MTAAGLSQGAAGVGPRRPVQRVLELPRDGWLYSGVEIRIASASAMAARRCATASGAGSLVIRVERGHVLSPSKIVSSSRPPPPGRRRAAGGRSGVPRRLPAMPSTLIAHPALSSRALSRTWSHQDQPAAGSGAFQEMPKSLRSTCGPAAGRAWASRQARRRARTSPAQLHRAGDAAQGELALDDALLALADEAGRS